MIFIPAPRLASNSAFSRQPLIAASWRAVSSNVLTALISAPLSSSAATTSALIRKRGVDPYLSPASIEAPLSSRWSAISSLQIISINREHYAEDWQIGGMKKGLRLTVEPLIPLLTLRLYSRTPEGFSAGCLLDREIRCSRFRITASVALLRKSLIDLRKDIGIRILKTFLF